MRRAGVSLTFGEAIDPETFETRFDSDVIVASDGSTAIRERFKEDFKPEVEIKRNRFCWMGSSRPMDAFNYFFRETEHGIICAHCYQYEPNHSTWVFEMDEACWQGHGFSEFDEADSKRRLEAIFADELQGHPLLLNRCLAAVSADILPQLVVGKDSDPGRCESVGAFFHRLRHETRHGVRHRTF